MPDLVLCDPGLVTVTVLPWLMIECEMAHALVSLDQVDYSVYVPLPIVTLAAPPAV